jgi:hypothetical protein
MSPRRDNSGQSPLVILGVMSSGPVLSLVAVLYVYGLHWVNPRVSAETFLLLSTVEHTLPPLAVYAYMMSAAVCSAWLLRRSRRTGWRAVLLALAVACGVLVLGLGLLMLLSGPMSGPFIERAM